VRLYAELTPPLMELAVRQIGVEGKQARVDAWQASEGCCGCCKQSELLS